MFEQKWIPKIRVKDPSEAVTFDFEIEFYNVQRVYNDK